MSILKHNTKITTTFTTTKVVCSNKKSMSWGINDYPGTSNDLKGCVNDAKNWANLLTSTFGFQNKTFFDSQAKKSVILEYMGNMIADSKAGDKLGITGSSHGTGIPDKDSDEQDGKDEAICLYDGLLVDDEIRRVFAGLHPEASLFVVSDSCLSGDTKIPLLDGTNPTIKELSERTEPFWVYSCTPDGDIVAGKGHSAKKTKKAETVKILLDSGEYLECTDDHLIMIKDGSYKKAGELVCGESLMPLNRKISGNDDSKYLKGYEMIKNPKDEKWIPTHHMTRDSIGLKKDGSKQTICHHINFNKRDNRPENLEMKTWEEHKKMHGEVGRKNLKELWKTKEYREWRSSKEYKKDQSERTLKRWESPEYREMHTKANIDRFERDGMPKTFLAYNYSKENSEKTRRRQAVGGDLYEIRQDPEFWQKMIGAAWKPEVAKKRSESRKKIFKDSNSNLYKAARTEERKELLKLMGQYRSYLIANKLDKKDLQFKQWKVQKEMATNHKVISVTKTNSFIDVYDLSVDKYHNFSVECGIFVHNCHSGSVTRMFLSAMEKGNEIKPRYLPPSDPIVAAQVLALPSHSKAFYPEDGMNHILLSGCKDLEYSYDAFLGGQSCGAMSYFALKIIRENPNQTYEQLHAKLKQYLPNGNYPQSPQLEGKPENLKKILFT